MSRLEPLHYSMQPHIKRTPKTLNRLPCNEVQLDTLHELALSIFTEAANAGLPFHQCLTTLYVSGLQHGSACLE